MSGATGQQPTQSWRRLPLQVTRPASKASARVRLTCFHDVASCAGDVGDDGALAAGPGVEQAGLADVGAADQRHPQPAVQQLPLPRRRQRILFQSAQRIVQSLLVPELYDIGLLPEHHCTRLVLGTRRETALQRGKSAGVADLHLAAQRRQCAG